MELATSLITESMEVEEESRFSSQSSEGSHEERMLRPALSALQLLKQVAENFEHIDLLPPPLWVLLTYGHHEPKMGISSQERLSITAFSLLKK